MLIIEPLRYWGLQLIKSATSAKDTPKRKDPMSRDFFGMMSFREALRN